MKLNRIPHPIQMSSIIENSILVKEAPLLMNHEYLTTFTAPWYLVLKSLQSPPFHPQSGVLYSLVQSPSPTSEGNLALQAGYLVLKSLQSPSSNPHLAVL